MRIQVQITKIMRIQNTGSTWSTWRRLTSRSTTSSCDPSTSCRVVFLKTISLSSSSSFPSFWTEFPAASWALLPAADSSTPKEEAQRERFSVAIITRATRRTTPSAGRSKTFSALVEELLAVDEEEAGGDDSYACSAETVAVSDRLEWGRVSLFCLLSWPDVWQRFSSRFSETTAENGSG